MPCWRLARSLQESFRTCDVGHRGTPFIVNYFCVSRPIDIFLDEVHMEFNGTRARTRTLAWGAGGIGGEITRAVLLAIGGLAGMAILVTLTGFVVSALF